jgi:hypothetical protein
MYSIHTTGQRALAIPQLQRYFYRMVLSSSATGRKTEAHPENLMRWPFRRNSGHIFWYCSLVPIPGWWNVRKASLCIYYLGFALGEFLEWIELEYPGSKILQ